MRRPAIALLLGFLAAAGLAAQAADGADAPATPAARVYAFQVLLDDKPIGTHRFVVDGEATARRVASDAAFAVTILGITAFRYRHHAEEQWAGDCLASLASTTDDDGRQEAVRLARAADGNDITSAKGSRSEPGCLMTYAYWNPALRRQARLLNPQTGQVDTVRVERVGTGTLRVHGQEVTATDWRITGAESPIDVWVNAQGDWVGLDSRVAKGRHRLSYRLP